MRAWIPKNQSMQLKTNNSAQVSSVQLIRLQDTVGLIWSDADSCPRNFQIQHISGLPKDWQEKKSRADQLCSRAPFYNHVSVFPAACLMQTLEK